jgi:hypothetical protein
MDEQNKNNQSNQDSGDVRQLTKKERRMLRREERSKNFEKSKSARSQKKFLVLGIILLTLTGAGFGIFKYLSSPIDIEKNHEQILATCVNHGNASVMHIHPVLSIAINGDKKEVPKNIGISAYCMRPIHTHDNSGELHVEFTRQYDFTLQDFFAIWEKPFSSTQILENVAEDTHEIVVMANNNRVENYENLVLKDNQHIEIIFQEKETFNTGIPPEGPEVRGGGR